MNIWLRSIPEGRTDHCAPALSLSIRCGAAHDVEPCLRVATVVLFSFIGMFGSGLIALAVAVVPFVNAASPEWGQVSRELTCSSGIALIVRLVLVRWYWLDWRHKYVPLVSNEQ